MERWRRATNGSVQYKQRVPGDLLSRHDVSAETCIDTKGSSSTEGVTLSRPWSSQELQRVTVCVVHSVVHGSCWIRQRACWMGHPVSAELGCVASACSGSCSAECQLCSLGVLLVQCSMFSDVCDLVVAAGESSAVAGYQQRLQLRLCNGPGTNCAAGLQNQLAIARFSRLGQARLSLGTVPMPLFAGGFTDGCLRMWTTLCYSVHSCTRVRSI